MLSKINRLTKRGSFTFVYNKGERKALSLVGLVFIKSKAKRIGFSVPNKVGKAVVRNRLKRQMRAIVRERVSKIAPCQAVFTLKAGADKLSFSELSKNVDNLLRRSKLVGDVNGSTSTNKAILTTDSKDKKQQ